MRILVLSIATLFLLLSGCRETNTVYAVLDVISGDRISIGYGNEQKIVKLCGTNVPSAQQAETKKLISDLVDRGNGRVKVVFGIGNTAEIYATTDNPNEEKMLSAELLVRGLAKFNPEDKCPNAIVLESLEEEAKSQRLGIWK